MIPFQFHICSFQAPGNRGGKPFLYVNYLCLYSVIKAHPGAQFNFYCNAPPEGEWFAKVRGFLNLHLVEPPTEIFGQPLIRVEHQADIFRLKTLQEKGGIYLDTDVYVCRDLHPLLYNRMVMGQEQNQGLCNAVIMVEPQSPFIAEWIAAYHPESTREGAGFKPEGWAEMSVRFPEILARSFQEYITIMPPTAFFEPMGYWKGFKDLFEDPNYENPDAWVQHLWASQGWEKYLEPMQPATVLASPGYFYRLVRRTLSMAEIAGTLESHVN